jgi:hypothetical protein
MGRIRLLPPLLAFGQAHATDLLALGGAACLVRGVGLLSAPAAWIMLGVLLLVTWWRLERGA